MSSLHAAPARKPTIAVVGTRPVDDKDRGTVFVSAQLTLALRAAIPSGRAVAVTSSFLDLISRKACVTEPDCIVKIGRDHGADLVVYGTLDRMPRDVFPAKVVLFDVATKTIVRTVHYDIRHATATEPGLRDHAKKIVDELAP